MIGALLPRPWVGQQVSPCAVNLRMFKGRKRPAPSQGEPNRPAKSPQQGVRALPLADMVRAPATVTQRLFSPCGASSEAMKSVVMHVTE